LHRSPELVGKASGIGLERLRHRNSFMGEDGGTLGHFNVFGSEVKPTCKQCSDCGF